MAVFNHVGFTVPMWSARTEADFRASMAELQTTGTNTVIIDYHLQQTSQSANSVALDPRVSVAQFGRYIEIAREHGFEVWIKPLATINDGGGWPNLAPTDPSAWFASYGARLVELSAAASAAGATTVLIGNELYSMTTNPAYSGEWADLINSVRGVFNGDVGYNASGLLSANMSLDEYLNITFADQLDLIGISAYPKLTDGSVSDVSQLEAAWSSDYFGNDLIGQLSDYIARSGIPVYLTELGFSPYQGSNNAYGNLVESGAIPAPDLLRQQAEYAASLTALARNLGDHLGGVFVYNWLAYQNPDWLVPPPYANHQYDWNTNAKPAETTISQWFNNAPLLTGISVQGGSGSDHIAGGAYDDLLTGGMGNDRLSGAQGNDTLTGGPNSTQLLSVLTVSITATGDSLLGQGPLFHVSINGMVVSSDFNVTSVRGRDAAQAFTFDIPATFLQTLTVDYLNEDYLGLDLDRNLFLRSIQINGVELDAQDGQNPGSIIQGTWDLGGGQTGGTSVIHDVSFLNQRLFFPTDNDILIGGLGNDAIDGGAGLDMALFTSTYASAQIVTSQGVTTVTSVEGIDRLANVERLLFSETILALDTQGNAGDAYRVYQAAFDRTPDRPGLSYWVNQMDEGMALSQVALNFYLSPEFRNTYGDVGQMSDAQFIDVMYQNVLHRDPDASGEAYWLNNMASGYSRSNVLAAFSQSAENQANVAAAIQNGILLELGAFL